MVTRFFGSRGAVEDTANTGQVMMFTRGREWISRWSWLVPCSETWPRQTIEVSIRQENGNTLVDVSYDVRMRHSMIAAPKPLVREVRELQCLLHPVMMNSRIVSGLPG